MRLVIPSPATRLPSSLRVIIILALAAGGVHFLFVAHADTAGGSTSFGSTNANTGRVTTLAISQACPNTDDGNCLQFGSPQNSILLGLDTHPTNVAPAISLIGKTPAVFNNFTSFEDDTGAPEPFPTDYANSIIAMGST